MNNVLTIARSHEVSEATPQLRWSNKTGKLQQAHIVKTFTMGEVASHRVEWRDVPLVDE